jgi:hypothetical protein
VAGHRPILVLGERLARRQRGAALGVRPDEALQPDRRPRRAANARAVLRHPGRRAVPVPRPGRHGLHRGPGHARPGEAGRRRRRGRPRLVDAHGHGDGLPRLEARPVLRGGACFTSVPGIRVVAEKHYAWALSIAAGIATNREGVPWGYLNSVNDVFKTPRAEPRPDDAHDVSGGRDGGVHLHRRARG